MMLAQDENKACFFSRREYLLTDSAYPADRKRNTIVPSYKVNTKGSNIEEFNTCVAHARVVNEHTIGVLKGRWCSLRELRVQLIDEDAVERALRWIQSCVVLHNMLLSFDDEWKEEDGIDDSSSDESDGDEAEDDDSEEDEDEFVFRKDLKRKAIAKGRQPGGILWHRNW